LLDSGFRHFDGHQAQAIAATLTVQPYALRAGADASFSDILDQSGHVHV
jgi:hypothetical protein